MIKLVATDIDGTLLPAGSRNPNREVSDMIKLLVHNGVKVVLDSGRPLSALECLFPEVADKLIYACSNGARIVQDGKTIFLQPMEHEHLASLFAVIRELHCGFMVDTDEDTIIDETSSEDFCRALSSAGLTYKKVKDAADLTHPVIKISVAYPEGPEAMRNLPIIKPFEKYYTLLSTGAIFFDAIPKNADKGTAITRLQQEFGILPEETVVFGDAENDIPMFRTTPNSYAAVNADESVKIHAKYTFQPPEQNGVIHCLKELL